MTTERKDIAPIINPQEFGKFIKEKALSDLRYRFRLTPDRNPEGIESSSVFVVTRFDDDLFFIELSYREIEPNPSYDRDGHFNFSATVRRRNGDHAWSIKGSHTLERWEIRGSSNYPTYENYVIQTNKGEILSQEDFWARYNASTIDSTATLDYSQSIVEENKKWSHEKLKLTWIAEEDSNKLTPEL